MRRHSNCQNMQIQYLAPEMINQYYNHQCDIWSLGILLYALLSGNAPFTGSEDSSIIEKILKQPINLETSAWEGRSKEVKQLLRKMLEKNFEKRVTVSEVLADPWMRRHKQKKTSREAIGECLQNMIRFTVGLMVCRKSRVGCCFTASC